VKVIKIIQEAIHLKSVKKVNQVLLSFPKYNDKEEQDEFYQEERSRSSNLSSPHFLIKGRDLFIFLNLDDNVKNK